MPAAAAEDAPDPADVEQFVSLGEATQALQAGLDACRRLCARLAPPAAAAAAPRMM